MDDLDLVVRAHELAISDAQYTLNDYKEMLKEQKCECYTCIHAPNKECGWYAACNNCIDGSNYWKKEERNDILQKRLEDYPWIKEDTNNDSCED